MEVIVDRVWNNFKKYRFLLAELVKKDIKLKYRRSYLGILWTLLEPLLTTAVLTFVFGNLLGKGGRTYPVYILTGRLLYTFFSNSTKAAMKSIRKNSGAKVYLSAVNGFIKLCYISDIYDNFIFCNHCI